MHRVFVSLLGCFYGGADFDRFLACGFAGTDKGRELGFRLDWITGKIMVRVCFLIEIHALRCRDES